MKVKCVKNMATSSIFTDGKVYEAFKEPGGEHCATWVVRDDLGYPRVILIGEPSPHLRIGANDFLKETWGRFEYYDG